MSLFSGCKWMGSELQLILLKTKRSSNIILSTPFWTDYAAEGHLKLRLIWYLLGYSHLKSTIHLSDELIRVLLRLLLLLLI